MLFSSLNQPSAVMPINNRGSNGCESRFDLRYPPDHVLMQYVRICGCKHTVSDGNVQQRTYAVVLLDCLTREERDRPFKDIMGFF